MELKRICVYCASSNKIKPAFFEATAKIAEALVNENIEVVFGGGATGLMGQLADTVLAHNGKIVGIMPHFMTEVEWSHKGVKDLRITSSMHTRKQQFLENIDGIIALAGGTGTLEELLEVITLKKLGFFTKPIVILNTDGYYDPLKEMLERCISENFMAEKHREMWTFVSQPEEVLPALKNAPAWSEEAIHFAAIK
jgi:uncharacterized protein (TIGR00730 family)